MLFGTCIVCYMRVYANNIYFIVSLHNFVTQYQIQTTTVTSIMLTRKNKAAKAAKKKKPEEAIVVSTTAPAGANKQANYAVATLVPTSNSSLGKYAASEGFNGGEVVTATSVATQPNTAAPVVAAELIPVASTSTLTMPEMKRLAADTLQGLQDVVTESKRLNQVIVEQKRAAEERRALQLEQEREAEARRALEDHVYQQEREQREQRLRDREQRRLERREQRQRDRQQDEFNASIHGNVSMNRRGLIMHDERLTSAEKQLQDQAEFLEGLGYSPKKK